MVNIQWRNCFSSDVGCQTDLNLQNVYWQKQKKKQKIREQNIPFTSMVSLKVDKELFLIRTQQKIFYQQI